VNIPFETTGLGDLDYLAAYQVVIEPIGQKFKPDLVIVACGFDAARGDPLGSMLLTPAGYYHLTARISANIQSKMTIVLEGGYNHTNVAKCSEAVVSAMLGDSVPLIRAGQDESLHPGTLKALKKVLRVQRRHWDCFDTPMHRAASSGQLELADLNMSKQTAHLKKCAKERSQIHQFGKVLPKGAKVKMRRGAKGSSLPFNFGDFDKVKASDVRKSSGGKRKRKDGSNEPDYKSLSIKVPNTKTGIGSNGKNVRPLAARPKGWLPQTPDSFESALSPLQQRKIMKNAMSPGGDRSYLAEDFKNSLLSILKSMVDEGSEENKAKRARERYGRIMSGQIFESTFEEQMLKEHFPTKVSTVQELRGRPVLGTAQVKQLAQGEALNAVPVSGVVCKPTSVPTASVAIPTASVLNTQSSLPLDLNSLLLSKSLTQGIPQQQQQMQQMQTQIQLQPLQAQQLLGGLQNQVSPLNLATSSVLQGAQASSALNLNSLLLRNNLNLGALQAVQQSIAHAEQLQREQQLQQHQQQQLQAVQQLQAQQQLLSGIQQQGSPLNLVSKNILQVAAQSQPASSPALNLNSLLLNNSLTQGLAQQQQTQQVILNGIQAGPNGQASPLDLASNTKSVASTLAEVAAQNQSTVDALEKTLFLQKAANLLSQLATLKNE